MHQTPLTDSVCTLLGLIGVVCAFFLNTADLPLETRRAVTTFLKGGNFGLPIIKSSIIVFLSAFSRLFGRGKWLSIRDIATISLASTISFLAILIYWLFISQTIHIQDITRNILVRNLLSDTFKYMLPVNIIIDLVTIAEAKFLFQKASESRNVIELISYIIIDIIVKLVTFYLLINLVHVIALTSEVGTARAGDGFIPFTWETVSRWLNFQNPDLIAVTINDSEIIDGEFSPPLETKIAYIVPESVSFYLSFASSIWLYLTIILIITARLLIGISKIRSAIFKHIHDVEERPLEFIAKLMLIGSVALIFFGFRAYLP